MLLVAAGWLDYPVLRCAGPLLRYRFLRRCSSESLRTWHLMKPKSKQPKKSVAKAAKAKMATPDSTGKSKVAKARAKKKPVARSAKPRPLKGQAAAPPSAKASIRRK